MLVRALRKLPDDILQGQKAFIDLGSLFLLGERRIRFLNTFRAGQIHEADLGCRASVSRMVKCVHYDREDEVRARRVFVHGGAGCLALAHTKLVDLLCILQR